MKLLRDFFRLRTAGRLSLSARRRAAARQAIRITVPAPLPPDNVIDMQQRKAESRRPLLIARWQEEQPQASRHLKLLSRDALIPSSQASR